MHSPLGIVHIYQAMHSCLCCNLYYAITNDITSAIVVINFVKIGMSIKMSIPVLEVLHAWASSTFLNFSSYNHVMLAGLIIINHRQKLFHSKILKIKRVPRIVSE